MSEDVEAVTVVGRHPVRELLRIAPSRVRRLHVAASARGAGLEEILQLAAAAGVAVDTASDRRLDALGPGEHQGVVAHADLPLPGELDAWLGDRRGRDGWVTSLLVVDGVTTPANLGIILRSAVASGMDAVVIPDVGSAGLGPATLKASAGVALAAEVVRTATVDDAVEILQSHAVEIVALEASGDPLFDAALPQRAAYVVGGESAGVSNAVRDAATGVVAIPMAAGVESLNVAAAASVLCYELVRRGLTSRPG